MGSIDAYTAQLDRVMGVGRGLFASVIGEQHVNDEPTGIPTTDTTGPSGEASGAAEQYRRCLADLNRVLALPSRQVAAQYRWAARDRKPVQGA